ncbi:MAG: YchF/TatD family DNA exonuclease [Deltaproteobacteria bacterium]|nr:YchF/TatD family DNA exonuclease [Deltaproteobacteria bacterium]
MEKSKVAPSLVDTHAHLDDQRFEEDREEVIERAGGVGVEQIITVACWDPQHGFEPTLKIADSHDAIYTAIGIHPHDARLAEDETFKQMEALAGRTKVVAIGETGLDYHYDNSPRDIQQEVFRRQIRLGTSLNLPIIIHTREADRDTLDILKEERAGDTGGVLHCFSGGYEMAKECLDMGLFLSFTGIITFPKAAALQEVVKKVPVERMLVETDCPYLAPVPYRGKRNEPAYVVETAKRIAELKGLHLDDVARITTLNAQGFFGIGEQQQRPEIAYTIRDSLYLAITNRCNNLCTFCAKQDSFTVKGHYLRLRYEPTASDVLAAIGPNPQQYKEIVFCGYGEPLIRLDLIKEVGTALKELGCTIRINTDGLANLVYERNILPEIPFVDAISVSLNAPDSDTYQRIVKTPFGERSFPAIIDFLREAKKHITSVTATVVAVPGLDVEACRRLAEEEIGVVFRAREYNEVG